MTGRKADRPKPKAPLPEGYVMLLLGVHSDIVVRERVRRDLEKKATREQRAGLEDLVKRYAQGGPASLPHKKFNGDEGWFPSAKAPGKVRLEAFKPWQLRAYGFCRDFNGRPTFFITGVDTAKKQDDANQNIVAAAGAEAVRVDRVVSSKGEANVAVRKG